MRQPINTLCRSMFGLGIRQPSAYTAEDDPAVPYQHSVMLQEALEKCGVPHKLKLGKVGGHGIGEGRGSDVEGWIDEAVEFWREQNMEGTEHGAGV